MKAIAALFLSFALLTGTGEAVWGQGKPERISFARGKDYAMLEGKITGYQYRDYVVRANKGQIMTVEVHSSNESISFVVMKPDGGNLIENDGTGKASETLPASGDYNIRVLLPRSAARRKGAAATYMLKVGIR
jgi:hypothetical protein